MITIDKEKDENQPLNKKARSLADIAKWGKITAVFLIITGSLSALSAIVTLLGAIPGGLLIISGVMLMRSAKAAAALQEGLEENAEENMLAHYASFIKMQFFYAASSVVLGILAFILVVIFAVIGIIAYHSTDTYDTPDSYYYENDPVFE
ncbi:MULTISPECIES: DUF5362 family protein [Bacillus]|uniref:DUF5362 family protein n=1 Tax=Bacillus TaxID=1386 RepID=UPI000B8C2B8E|nr:MULTISPECIES: DUF5362 family protein [Bacillus]OXS82508.1 hypothetical protein B1726_13760 [Bacillus sp. LYLB4]UOO17600.1 hypothetical protein KHA74_18135 [Bacillus velezensis]WNJ15331.1 DUF5362 family protein [Bacillus velezensis]